MKNSVIALLTLATCTFSIGCASSQTASTSSTMSDKGAIASSESTQSNLPAVASNERTERNLPVVADAPSTSWGGNSLLY